MNPHSLITGPANNAQKNIYAGIDPNEVAISHRRFDVAGHHEKQAYFQKVWMTQYPEKLS